MLLLTILIVCLIFGIGAVMGAPYLPILSRDREALLDLAEASPGQQLIDLGSGDGRLLLAAARRGLSATGYEINPFLYLVSLIVTWRYRRHVTIKLADYWHVVLPQADIIYVFLIDRYMEKLDRKLSDEVSSPTKVVSFVFKIPGRQAVRSSRNASVYIYGELE